MTSVKTTGDKKENPMPTIPDGHIDIPELTAVLITANVTKSFLVVPERLASAAQTAAWSVPLFSAAASFFWIYPLIYVLKKHPHRNLIEISTQYLGKTASYILGTILYVMVISLAFTGISEISGAITVVVLPLTPPRSFLLIVFATALFMSSRGTETLSHTSLFFCAFIVLAVILNIILTIPIWRIRHALPLLGPGLKNLFKVYMVRQSVYVELIILGFMGVYIRKPDDLGKIARNSMLISSPVLAGAVLAPVLSLSYPYIERQIVPFLRIARLIDLGGFLQRFDSLFVIAWLSSGILHLTLGIYFGALILGTLFGAKDYRPFLPIGALLGLAGSFLIPSVADIIVLDFDILRPYSIPFVYLWVWALSLFTYFSQKQSAGSKP